MTSSFLHLVLVIWLTALATITVFKILPMLHRDEEKTIKELRQRITELENSLKTERLRCDELLRDAAVKNAVMTALYNAWKNNLLRKCYMEGGEVRVLADGTVICELPDREKSYAVGGAGGE